PSNDRRHLCGVRDAACCRRISLRPRHLIRDRPDHRLDGDLLLRLGGGELGLSHRERDLPLEVRALAIAFFYAVGTGIGGVAGPWSSGALTDTGSRWSVLGGYLLGSVLMLAAALIAARFGVAAERKPLESVSRPLAAAE